MTLRHLRIYIAVCQYGSVTAAARKLYIAQPTVSLVIRELEDHYQVRLFDRIARRLQITEAGRRLYEYALHIDALYHEMEERMASRESLGPLRLGASITIGNRLLPGLTRRMAASHPELPLRVRIDNSGHIEQEVLSGNLDIGLIEGIAHHPQLDAEEFLEDELVLLCGQGHPLWPREWVKAEELPAYRFVLREKGSGTRELFDSALLTRHLLVEPVWESVSTQAILEILREGWGLSVLPYRLVEHCLLAGHLRRIPIEDMRLCRKFYMVTHRKKYRTPDALLLMEAVRGIGDWMPPIPDRTPEIRPASR